MRSAMLTEMDGLSRGMRWRRLRRLTLAACAWVVTVATIIPSLSWGQPGSGEGSEEHRRRRSDAFSPCISSNTAGQGNIWVTARGQGFIWDDPDTGKQSVWSKLVPFLEADAEIGVLGFLSVIVDTRISSYFYGGRPHFGHLALGLRGTLPNNRDLRYNGLGLQLMVKQSFAKQFKNIGALRNDQGFGFSPEGFLMGGTMMETMLAYDRDYIAKLSRLPLKLTANLGMRIPFDAVFVHYSQYLVRVAAGLSTTTADVYVAYTLDAFLNRSVKPKQMSFELAPPNNNKDLTWEVAFPENPMYIVLGGRVRYPRGIELSASVPLLLSTNIGSSLRQDEKDEFMQKLAGSDASYKYYDEIKRGITTPFDPWYAKWKIVAELTIPIRYRQTGAEMRRTFLLRKNRKKDQKIDIDERMRLFQQKALEQQRGSAAPADTVQTQQQQDQKRLDEIKKRREEATLQQQQPPKQ